MGFGFMNRFIDHLYTPLTTESNYIAFALYKITRAHAKSSQFAFTSRFQVTDINNEDSPASVLTSLLSGEYPATELSQPVWGPRYIASGRTQQKTPLPTMFYFMGGFLAISRVLLTCLPVVTK
jgi:hypothetical protein